MMQAEAAVCHQCKKHGINFEKKEPFVDDRPALMDVGRVACVRVFTHARNWFQGCSFLICEGSLAVEATAF